MASSFDKTTIIIIKAPMPDQGVIIGRQCKEILPFGIRQNHPAGHRYSVRHKKIGDNRS
ncbi:hypothetical protein [Rhizobium ruizarguesonis]|uniref:hypothetical protein n=1 Tax=Rhizobium ruizarguesonis TaxID=2081791 RepID=UPI001FDEB6DF|nr:hypothetical protein [Rhizobium ruizarguesonis]